jgi:hypothetical protein
MADFTVHIEDVDIDRVMLALCDISGTLPSVDNAVAEMEDLVVRITKDFEARLRAKYVPPIPPDPQITVVAVISGPTPLL